MFTKLVTELLVAFSKKPYASTIAYIACLGVLTYLEQGAILKKVAD